MSGKFRTKKVYFTQVSNNALRDNDLSLKAKGLYALIQSYITIEDFVLYKTTLLKMSTDGEKGFRSAWNELKEKGYLVQYKMKDHNGKWVYEYELLDARCLKSTSGATSTKTASGFTASGKKACIINTNINNTDFNNTVVVVDSQTQEKLTLLEQFNIKTTNNQRKLLEKLDTELLEVALDTTIAQEGKSFSYLHKVYLGMEKALEGRSSSATEKKNQLNSIKINNHIISQNKTKFHNFKETFTKYSDDELEQMILEQQKEKWS